MKNDAAKVTVLRHGAPVHCIDDDDTLLLYVLNMHSAKIFMGVSHRN